MTDIERAVADAWAGSDAERHSTRHSPRHIPISDPADGIELFRAPVASEAEVAHAVERARSASRSWAATAAAERGAALHRAADQLAAHVHDLARLVTREMGKPIGDARGGVEAGVATLRQYAELGPVHRGRSLLGGADATDFIVYEPRGVVAAITPWNDPVAVSCGLIGAALATGNTVVYKPSERTPATGWLTAHLIREAVPEGVLGLLIGDAETGASLARQPVDVIAHVGSSATGRQIAQAALERGAGVDGPTGTGAKVLLENGGNDALIVDAGVHPGWAAAQAALGAFANAGQICVSVERVYVHDSLVEEFLEALVARALALRQGPGLDPATELGPLVDRRHRDGVHRHVEQAMAEGAKVLCGGEIPSGPGAFYPATVLRDCTDEMAVLREETFGPVAPVVTVGSFAEALERAAAGVYGLGASVLTADIGHAQRAWRALPVGTVKINNVFGGAPGGSAHPRRASGQGYGYGPELLDEMTQAKVVHLEPADLGQHRR